jgi:hypothetical protein
MDKTGKGHADKSARPWSRKTVVVNSFLVRFGPRELAGSPRGIVEKNRYGPVAGDCQPVGSGNGFLH